MSRRNRKRIFEQVRIIDFAHKGQAIGKKQDGEILIVDKVVPGDIVDVITYRKKKKIWHASPVKWHIYSDHRIKEKCAHFGVCGGCKWQHVDYQAQLGFKEKMVRDSLQRIGGLSVDNVLSILPSPRIFGYRNKMEYSFSNMRWLTEEEIQSESSIDQRNALGLHPAGYFDRVVDITHCHLQDNFANEIRNFVKSYTSEHGYSYYDVKHHRGIMRSLVIRQGTFSEQSMVNIIFGEPNPDQEVICEALHTSFPSITSINYAVNTKQNDSIFDLEFSVFHGPGYIEEQIDQKKYRIGPKSFFQTNSYQARNMFQQIKAYADRESYSTLYDLYCGAGSIGLYLADRTNVIVGIEEIEEAVEQARINQHLNQVSNSTFYQGDVRLMLQEELLNQHGYPDLIVVDPPRAGLHHDVAQYLLHIKAPRIIYVSCNPATQARDLKILSQSYAVIESQPLDMFPHTHHTENITLLKKY